MRALIVGISGVMGRVMQRLAGQNDFYIVAGCDSKTGISALGQVDCDVVIEFAAPSATHDTLAYAVKNRIPAVIATTGHSQPQTKEIYAAAKEIPVFFDSNFSLGAAALAAAAKTVKKLLPSADVAIVETHRAGKKDTPGGTAKKLKAFLGNDADIFSVRLGDERGRHDVIFSLPDQTLVLTHKALSREAFARGAITAARYVLDKGAGLYTMENILYDA